MPIRMLVEHAFTRAASHLLRLRRIREQLAIGVDGLRRVLDDQQLRPRLEPALEAVVRVRDDRRARRRELERPAGRRGVDGRVRAASDAEIDTRSRDRAGEDVEGDVADLARVARVALEVASTENEVRIGERPRRLADHRLDPVAAELVAIAVEEQVVLLLDLVRREELRIRSPEDRLRAPRAALA